MLCCACAYVECLIQLRERIPLMNIQLMIKVHCLDRDSWYLQTSAGCRTAVFYLHTEEECEKVGKKWFWGDEFCTWHFPFSVLGQAA